MRKKQSAPKTPLSTQTIRVMAGAVRASKKSMRPAKKMMRDISRASWSVKIAVGFLTLITLSNIYGYLFGNSNFNSNYNSGASYSMVSDNTYLDYPDVVIGNVPEFLKGSKNVFEVPEDLQNVPDESCPNPFVSNWDVVLPSAHTANPELFLIPILMGDASQQIVGLQNTMALAVHLNRTLIMPPMYRSEDDNDDHEEGDILVDSSIRIDNDAIRTYVSTIPLIKGIEVCQGQIHIAFLARPVDKVGRFNRVHNFEKATGLRLTEGDLMAVPMQPSYEQISDSNRGIVAPIESPVWGQIYGNDNAICAAYILPFMSMEVSSSWHQTQSEVQSMIQRELIEHTTIPKYSMAIAQDFLEMHYQGSSGFLGVHWKFDHNDWLKGCDKTFTDQLSKQQACEVLSKATHKDIAGGILAYMSEKFDKKKHSVEGVKNYGAYIATGFPDLAADQVADITIRVLDEVGGHGFVYTTSYLVKWLNKRYSQCALTASFLQDVVSVIEHHILFESKVLLFQVGDPWSTRVMNDRKVVGKFSRPGDKGFMDVLTNFIMGQPAMKMNPMTKQELKKRLSELQISG